MVELDARRIGVDAITSRHVKDLEISLGDIADLTITDAKISPTAAIAYSKLDLADSIVDADINTAAAIEGSKISPDVTNAVIGVGAGYKIARGKTSVTGTADIATGLTTVVEAVACLAVDAALTGDCVTVADSATSGNIVLKVWKRTSASDCTPVAATAAKSVRWIAVGT